MERIKSLISMAVSAHGLAAEARRHFEIDPDTFGFIDTAYWLCADLRDEIGRAADEIEAHIDDMTGSEMLAALREHARAAEWYDTLQGDCDGLVTFATTNSHTIRRS